MGIARVLQTVVVCVLASRTVTAELERLPAASTAEAPKPQVRLSMQLFEVSRTKLRDLKHHPDQDAILPDNAKDGFWQVVEDAEKVDRVMNALKDLRREIAQPTLLAISGQPAEFRMGKRIQIPSTKNVQGQQSQHLDYGTMIESLQEVQEDGSLKLTVSLSQVDLAPEWGLKQGGQTIPGVKRREMKTSANLHSGQTLVLCGMGQQRVEATRRKFWGPVEETVNEIETVLIVRPEYSR